MSILHVECGCDDDGSNGFGCSDSGQCDCLDNVEGLTCDHCRDLHYGFPFCQGTHTSFWI